MERFGPENDGWIGERLIVVCRRTERSDSSTGAGRTEWKRHLEFPDGHNVGGPEPAWVGDHSGADDGDPIGATR